MSDLMMMGFQSVRPAAGRMGAQSWAAWFRMVLRAHRTRQALLQLTPEERADVGISCSAALKEAARLPWDVTPGPRRSTGGAWAAVQRVLERARTRRLIGRMEPRDLRDIAVSASTARDESGKFFWQC